MITYQELLKSGENELVSSNISDAELDAWYLLEYLTGMSRAKFFLDRDMEVSDEIKDRYLSLIHMRKEHIPLQHITGTQEFMGFDFFVNENVLVPRQDTECLVENVLPFAHGKKILDMCTGSGCIIISLKKLEETAECTGADISKKALEVAQKNAASNEAEVYFKESDMFEKINGKYDIIVSNPPYIKKDVIKKLSKDVQNEPIIALDGGKDGLVFYKKIVNEAIDYLKLGGYLCLEIGYDQKKDVMDLIKENLQYINTYSKKDLYDNDRIVVTKVGG